MKIKRLGKIFAFIVFILFLCFLFFILTVNRLFLTILKGDEGGFNKNYKLLSYYVGIFDLYKLTPVFLDGNYLVLLQNSNEIRPSGGFMGSYARVSFKNGVLKEWSITDIYTPDGQIKGYVENKMPLQQAFHSGTWRLANSNWEIDFSKASRDIIWFFNKAGEKDIKGVVALDLEFIRRWIAIIGEVKPQEYPETLNYDNFYLITQSYSEDDFFPGSHSKKNYLSGVGSVMLSSTLRSGFVEKVKILKLLYEQLEKGHILVWIDNEKLSEMIKDLNWGGGLDNLGDYDLFYSVESNLGANKTNICVTRKINQEVSIDGNVENKTAMFFYNDTDGCRNYASDDWIGRYVNYQRILIPLNSNLISVKVGEEYYTKSSERDLSDLPEIENDTEYFIYDKENYKEVSFWVIVPENKSNTVEIIYTIPKKHENGYSMYVKRQPGIYHIPYSLSVNGKMVVDTILIKDRLFRVKL